MRLDIRNKWPLFIIFAFVICPVFCSFDALVLRFEAPDSRNRWDSPLFTILKDDTLPFEAISDALFKRKAPPPNQSTQSVSAIHTCRIHFLTHVNIFSAVLHFWLPDCNRSSCFPAATTVVCKLLVRVRQDHTRRVNGMFLSIVLDYLLISLRVFSPGASLSLECFTSNFKVTKVRLTHWTKKKQQLSFYSIQTFQCIER